MSVTWSLFGSKMFSDEVVRVIENSGLAVLLVVAGGAAAWRGMRWLGAHVVQPLVDSHTKLIEQLRESDVKQTRSIEALTASQQEIISTQRDIVSLLRMNGGAKERKGGNES